MTGASPRAGISVGLIVIEDDWFVVNQITEALLGSRYHIIEAVSSVDGAFRVLERSGRYAAILDGTLRGQATTGIARHLQANRVPFIVATGSPPFYHDAIRQSIPAVLKPFGRQDLLAALDRLPLAALG